MLGALLLRRSVPASSRSPLPLLLLSSSLPSFGSLLLRPRTVCVWSSSLSSLSLSLLSSSSSLLSSTPLVAAHERQRRREHRHVHGHVDAHRLARRLQSTDATTATPGARCWRCDAAPDGRTSALVCALCDAVQPPSESIDDATVDVFELFQCAPTFAVDVDALERTYRRLQMLVHPDRQTHATTDEQRWAAAHSARLNEMYRVLREPASRAVRVLSARGVDEAFLHSASDAALLAEVMEKRELIEEHGDQPTLRALDTELTASIDGIVNDVGAAFERNDIDAAQRHTTKLVYWTKMLDETRERLVLPDEHARATT